MELRESGDDDDIGTSTADYIDWTHLVECERRTSASDSHCSPFFARLWRRLSDACSTSALFAQVRDAPPPLSSGGGGDSTSAAADTLSSLLPDDEDEQSCELTLEESTHFLPVCWRVDVSQFVSAGGGSQRRLERCVDARVDDATATRLRLRLDWYVLILRAFRHQSERKTRSPIAAEE